MRNLTPQNPSSPPATTSDATLAPKKVKQVPKWITGCVISMFVVGAGFLMYHAWYSEPGAGDEIELKDGDIVPRSPGALARRFAPPAEGVHFNRNKDGATVRSGDVEMRVNLPGPKHEATDFNIYYARNYLTPEQSLLFAARGRLAVDAATAKYIGVSTEQRKELKGISMPNMQVSDDDRDHMKQLWTVYAAAPNDLAKGNAEDAMVDALKQIGDANLEKTRAVAAERCDKISSILSSDQIQKFKAMGKNPSPARNTVAKVDAKG
jgi:hypothetical protein